MIRTKLDSLLLKTGFCSGVCASKKQALSLALVLTLGVSFLFSQDSEHESNDLFGGKQQ